ncbi:hypothetical protein C8R45DRAFT_1206613 [Mycena sanguinolenta]|nr:hypothetical protein C8R45DRAFT_1206613 [Mycena sanguinolenta]
MSLTGTVAPVLFKWCLTHALHAGLVRAIDNFLLYNLPPGVTVDPFTDAFDAACAIWPAAIAEDLTFFVAQVDPPLPPVAGEDPDAVRITCTWLDASDNFIQFAGAVAQALGSTPIDS